MRWIAAFFITVVISSIAAGLLWLRSNTLFGLDPIRDVAESLIPGSIAIAIERFQVWLIFGTWSFILVLLKWWSAYSDSATEASPRDGFGSRIPVLDHAYHAFHNPSKWWLAPYTALLSVLLVISGSYVLWFNRHDAVTFAWGITSLFAASLIAATASPDAPQNLRHREDHDPDSILDIPEEQVATQSID